MNQKPLMIAHRGASIYELENTRSVYCRGESDILGD